MTERDSILKCLDRLEACLSAYCWVTNYPGKATTKTLWRKCKRPDWLLWVVGALAEHNAYYRRAAGSAISAMIDCLVEARIEHAGRYADVKAFPDDAFKVILEVSTVLDNFGQTGRGGPAAKRCKHLLEITALDHTPFPIHDLMEYGTNTMLCGSKDLREYDNWIIQCSGRMETFRGTSFLRTPALEHEMCREIRRVVECPTLRQLQTCAAKYEWTR